MPLRVVGLPACTQLAPPLPFLNVSPLLCDRRGNFTSADMRYADFSGSNFVGAYLEKAVAAGTNFEGTT